MPEIPQRLTLTIQTEQILIEGLMRGTWKFRLPGERALAKELQISRGTLRTALRALANQNLIRIHRRRKCEILSSARKEVKARRLSRIACLAPVGPWQLAPFVVLYMDDLRARLQRRGVQLDVYHSSRYFKPNCSNALAELVARNPHSGWLLLLATRSMQRWFEERRVPAVVAGSLHDGIRLPSFDTDFRTVGRHAGGAMFAHGHYRIALLASNMDRGPAPGTLEIAEGLRQAFSACRHPEKELTVLYHEASVASVRSCLDRLLNLPRHPTAIVIGHTTTLLTAITHLAQRKILVPDDLSLVVTHSEPFYDHIVPELTHYDWDADRFALEACRLFEPALNGAPLTNRSVRLMPRFVPGKTLAPLRSL